MGLRPRDFPQLRTPSCVHWVKWHAHVVALYIPPSPATCPICVDAYPSHWAKVDPVHHVPVELSCVVDQDSPGLPLLCRPQTGVISGDILKHERIRHGHIGVTRAAERRQMRTINIQQRSYFIIGKYSKWSIKYIYSNTNQKQRRKQVSLTRKKRRKLIYSQAHLIAQVPTSPNTILWTVLSNIYMAIWYHGQFSTTSSCQHFVDCFPAIWYESSELLHKISLCLKCIVYDKCRQLCVFASIWPLMCGDRVISV